MTWSSGATGGVALAVPSPVGVRWMYFGLSSAYELGQWQASDTPPHRLQPIAEFTVTLGGGTELPLPSALEEVPWSETVLGELGTLRPGLTLEWELRPDSGLPSREMWLSRSNDQTEEEPRVWTVPERGLKDRQEARRTGLRWGVRGGILVDGHRQTHESAVRVARLLEAASHLDGGNGLVCRPVRSPLARFRHDPVFSEAEVVGLFPPPGSVAFREATPGPPERARLWLGRDLRGSCVGLPIDAVQGRHLLVLGETGMGKSSLVVRLAWQAARWGSVILFDPVGDTSREFLAGVPESRAPQVSWFSPSVPGLSLSLLMEVASRGSESSTRRERLLSDVVAALRRVRAGRYSESSYWGPRLEEMLFQAMRAASHWPGASLAVAERLLTPEGFPWRTVPESAREAVREVRRRIEHGPQDGDGARRLLSEITRSDVLREMLDAASPTWSVGAAVAPRRITVVSGDAPEVGESVARYLLAIVLALAWNAVLVRERPSKTFLILDEAQWYAHDSLAEMLRLGRRFNLHVWAATQSLHSLPEAVRDALTTNSADVVLFRGDPVDVRDVSRWVPQLAPERVMRMPRGEAAVLIDKGSETHWVHLLPLSRGNRDPLRFRPAVPTTAPAEVAGASRPSIEELPPPLSMPANRYQWEEATPLKMVLWEVMRREHGGSELIVRLAELRSRWPGDPASADQWVRNAGRLLSSTGIIVRTGRDCVGSFWVLSRERLAELLPSEPGGPEPAVRAEAQIVRNGEQSHDAAI
ncbi:MAG: DUF87 domain-containing protein [Thermoplasmata archaeon]